MRSRDAGLVVAALAAGLSTAALAGIVMNQATITRLATDQRTALDRRAAPVPTIEPVIACVVETGMPSALAPKTTTEPAVEAQNPE